MRTGLTLLMLLLLSTIAVGQGEKKIEQKYVGNKSVDTEVLRNAFNKCLSERDYEADDEDSYRYCFGKVETVFWQEGNLRARLKSVSILEEDSKYVVVVEIDEGKKYSFAGLDVRTRYFSQGISDYVGKLIPLEIGELSRLPKFACSLSLPEEVLNEFRTNLSLDVVPEFDDEEGTVRFVVFVSGFDNTNFSRVEFLGNEQTRDLTLRRPLCYGEGTLYSNERLEADIMRLNNARVVGPVDFARDVEVLNGTHFGQIDVIIRVKEIN